MPMKLGKGAEFATQRVNNEDRPLVDVERVVNAFISQNMPQQATPFLLKDHKLEQAHPRRIFKRISLK